MGKKIDMTGMRYGRLVVVKEADRRNGHVAWEVKCDCGNSIIVRGIDLRNGNTTSCDCYRKEQQLKAMKKKSELSAKRKHALALGTK